MNAIITGIFTVICFIIFVGIILYGCTLNIVLTDTHGHASDVSDVTSTDSADLEPVNFDLP